MKKGIGEVTRRTGPNLITVTRPNDITMYQQNMDGADRGDQHRVMGAGFPNVAHFKKWYKRLSWEFLTSVSCKPSHHGT